MFNKLFCAIFLFLILISASFAQSETQWEYLEVIRDSRQTYSYWNENTNIKTEISLENLGKSGWELVGVGSGYTETLIFKRKYVQSRTLKEIAALKAKAEKFEKSKETVEKFNLIDLEIKETKKDVAEYNQNQEKRLREILESINEFPIKIISIESISKGVGYPNIGAELTVDATALLKNKNQYRSSEADIYLQKVVDRIKEIDQFTIKSSPLFLRSKVISTGYKSPVQIGKFPASNSGINIMVSLVANFDGQQNIIAQAYLYGMKWNDEKEGK